MNIVMKIMAIIITTIIRLTSDIPGFGSPRRLSIYERNEIEKNTAEIVIAVKRPFLVEFKIILIKCSYYFLINLLYIFIRKRFIYFIKMFIFMRFFKVLVLNKKNI